MEQSVIGSTLVLALHSLWDTFGPLLLVGGGFALLAFVAFVWRKITNVG